MMQHSLKSVLKLKNIIFGGVDDDMNKLIIHGCSNVNLNHNMSNIYLERLKDVNVINQFQKLNELDHVFANYSKCVWNLQCVVVILKIIILSKKLFQ